MRRVSGPEPVDLLHLGVERVIGVYVVETEEGPALFDCGPATCFERLRAAVDLAEIRYLLLSHIHLDHAGAAGHVVRENPSVQVHVSEVGAPHVVQPGRLIASARRIYGDALDVIYGEPEPVPAANVHVAGSRVAGLDCFPAPGHATHHVCYLDADATLYAGDATGVRILPGRHVLPHAPPPDADVDAWLTTFAEIERRSPARLALTHFGVAHDAGEHVARARETLEIWSDRVASGMGEDEFVGCAHAELVEAEGPQTEQYDRAGPLAQSHAGLSRYWKKRREAAA